MKILAAIPVASIVCIGGAAILPPSMTQLCVAAGSVLSAVVIYSWFCGLNGDKELWSGRGSKRAWYMGWWS